MHEKVKSLFGQRPARLLYNLVLQLQLVEQEFLQLSDGACAVSVVVDEVEDVLQLVDVTTGEEGCMEVFQHFCLVVR